MCPQCLKTTQPVWSWRSSEWSLVCGTLQVTDHFSSVWPIMVCHPVCSTEGDWDIRQCVVNVMSICWKESCAFELFSRFPFFGSIVCPYWSKGDLMKVVFDYIKPYGLFVCTCWTAESQSVESLNGRWLDFLLYHLMHLCMWWGLTDTSASIPAFLCLMCFAGRETVIIPLHLLSLLTLCYIC